MTYIPRLLDKEILSFINDPQANKSVLLVEGARQVGKSFLVEHALRKSSKKCFSLNLEKETRLRALIDECGEFRDFEQLLRDRIGFDAGADHVLFFDEAQESRKLGLFVRFMKEDWSHATVILSGSTLSRLFREGTHYPVGRVKCLLLGPFSFSEFLVAAGHAHLAQSILTEATTIGTARHEHLLTLYDQFLLTGGLPAAVLASTGNQDTSEVLAQILADYEQDFIRIFGEKDADIVKACFRSVSNFVGGPSKNSTVIPSPGTRVNARINEVFARLEAWHLILRSDQMGPGTEASHAYLPKRYLFDTGILRHLREVAVPSIRILGTLAPMARQPLGGVIENQTAIELARQGMSLCGWKKTPSGGEIDFVVKHGTGTCPIECKSSLTFDRKNIRGICEYLAMYRQPVGFVISLAPYTVFTLPEDRRVINLPIYLMESLPSFHAQQR
jgi:predicted AAA+ superfamily ATPase